MLSLPALHNAVAIAGCDAAVLTVHVYPFQQLVTGALMVAEVQFLDERRAAEIPLACVEDEVHVRSSLIDADGFNHATLESTIGGYKVRAKPIVALLACCFVALFDAMRVTLADSPHAAYILIRLVARTLVLRRHRARNGKRGAGK